MVYDTSGSGTDRARLNGFDIPLLGQTCRSSEVREQIRTGRRDAVRWKSDDEIWFADGPLGAIFELTLCWHVGRIASRGAGVDPRGDGRDVAVGQREIVLE